MTNLDKVMATQTRRDKLVEALTNEGFRLAACNSQKYLKMVRGSTTYWIGKNGAVRSGKTISNSISLTDWIKV